MDSEAIDGGDGRPPGCAGRVAVSIYRYFPHGGLQREMMSAVRALRRRNYEVTIFCMSWESSEIPSKVAVRRLRVSGASNSGKARKFDLALTRVLKKRNFDFHLSFNKVASADCYFVDDLPFARSAEQIPLWRRIFSQRWRIYSKMERQVFAGASDPSIICLSKMQQQAYQKLYSTPADRFVILPPGVDDRFCDALDLRNVRRSAIRQELGLKEDERAIFFIGSAFYTKGADRAIAALAAVPSDSEVVAKLFIVGHNDNEKLRHFAKRCGVDEQVVFLGARNDVPELLAGADLLIHPARSEAAGSVLLEAICSGTPVLCSGNCGYAAFVEESGGVVLPMPFRQKHLNRALMLVLTVPGNLDEMQQAAVIQKTGDEFYRRGEVIADIIVEKMKRASDSE